MEIDKDILGKIVFVLIIYILICFGYVDWKVIKLEARVKNLGEKEVYEMTLEKPIVPMVGKEYLIDFRGELSIGYVNKISNAGEAIRIEKTLPGCQTGQTVSVWVRSCQIVDEIGGE